MRMRQIPLAVLIALTSSFGTVSAENVWQGSYSADGQCFCSGDLPAAIALRIVPTPIGGQTVKQVCARVGVGPGLVREDGLFNHPVFKDPQCGHGPFESAGGPRDVDCVGTLDGTYASCQSAGPRWSLATAYATQAELAAAKPATSDEQSTDNDISLSEKAGGNDGSGIDLKSDAIDADPDVAQGSANGQSAGKASRADVLAAFKGRSVMLGDERFLQAREDMPAQGGAPGSRIILDGLVFLKDDENLVIADLYQESKEPEIAAAAPAGKSDTATVDKTETEERKVIPPTMTEQVVEAPDAQKPEVEESVRQETELQARLQLEQMEREARARAEFERDQRLKEARLAEQKKMLQGSKPLAERKQHEQHTELPDNSDVLEQETVSEQQSVAREKRLEQQKQLIEQKKLAERTRQEKRVEQEQPQEQSSIIEKQVSAGNDDNDAVAQATRQVNSPVDNASMATESPVLSALRLPAHTRASSRDFAYIEAMPVSYDFGGSGLMLEGSAQSSTRFQYLGRLGVADTYREAMVGGGYYMTPAVATRMTVVLLAGVEFGSFELRDEESAPDLNETLSDTGLYLGAMSRLVVNNKFELKGGVGYSTFFQGDTTVFGGGYYHVTPRLDVMSRFELGDNDALGIGIRYYY